MCRHILYSLGLKVLFTFPAFTLRSSNFLFSLCADQIENIPPDKPREFDYFLRSNLTSKAFPEWGIWSFLVGWGKLNRKCKVSSVFFFRALNSCKHVFGRDGSNCRIPCHSKLYPLKSGYLATQFVHTLSLFYVFKRRNSCYAAKWLGGYVAHWLKNELNCYVACLFLLKDYCFGTLNELNSCVARLFPRRKISIWTKASTTKLSS